MRVGREKVGGGGGLGGEEGGRGTLIGLEKNTLKRESTVL